MHKFADYLDKPFTKETKKQFLDFLQNDFLKGSFKPVFDKDGVVADYVSGLSFIKQVNILGSADNLKDLIVLEIIKRNDIGDSRIGLTKEIFKLIANKDFLNKPRFNVLAIVRGEEPSKTWRFSLITSEGDKKSSPKRFSFLLGEGEKVKTVKKSIIEPLGIKDFDDLVDRFDVEVVRKEFFALYMDLFLELYGEIKDNDTFKVLIDQGKIEPVSFAKNLMGKMIFLYFIQKKGWLGITDPNGKFGDGDRDFFKNNFDNLAHKGNLFRTSTNFYNDFLEPLFYSGLNKKNEYDWNKQLSMKVPYLNGGLFEEEYDWENTVINLNNSIFKSIIDCFDTYNFTIDEDDPIDREIAVDPEMLGKIFESMISVNNENIDRIWESYLKAKKRSKLKELSPDNILSINIGTDINKELGAFYTPREIVKYMTQESLIAYLSEYLSKTNSKPIEETEGVTRILFSYKEKHLSQREIDEDKVNGYNLIKGYVFDIQKALKQIKIIDPAVGSGAFPMGILQEILGLNRYLIDTFDLNDESDFDIKKQIIQNNIHGIDIDPGAVDIARLRFWLSLIVDSEDPVPLPNLDFKFVCANSLIPLDQGGLFVNEDFANNLKDIKDRFFSCCDHTEKENLKKEFMKEKLSLFSIDRDKLNSLRGKDGRITESYKNAIADLAKGVADKKNKQLLDWDPFNTQKPSERFDPKMMFDIEKFDIVIGNPPYLFLSGKGSPVAKLKKEGKLFEAQKMKELLDKYADLYPSVSQGCQDFYKRFFKKGLLLCKDRGILCYITPDTFFSMPKYSDLRKEIFYHKVKFLIDLGFSVFEVPKLSAGISLIKKDMSQTDYTYYIDIKNVLDKNNRGNFAQFLSDYTQKISIKNNNLDAYKNELAGRIYNNTADFKSIGTENSLLSFTEGEHNIEISDYIYEKKPGYVEALLDGEMKRNSYIRTVYIKSSIDKNKPLHKGDRCLLRKTGDSIVVAIPKSNDFAFGHQNTYIVKPRAGNNLPMKFWMAFLNSKLLTFLYQNGLYGQKGRMMAQFRVYALNVLPVPINIIKEKNIINNIIEIIDNVLELNEKNMGNEKNSILENQIDQLVYQLYGLTKEEIQIVEDNMK